MGTPFISEIKIMSFNFAPKGWALCNGQLLPINQNQALFSLLGTTYGGDGRTTFALPNLQGRAPMHTGAGHVLGESAGEINHTLISSEMPTHLHQAQASTTAAVAPVPTANALAGADIYSPLTNPVSPQPATVANAGGSQPHTNMQPYLTLTFCIALVGAFPSRN
ncbi:MAG: phage tail protein [Roseiflexaceae bacterium]